MAKHRGDMKHKNRTLYQHMSEIGVDKFYIELIEEYPCNNIEQLLKREGFYIRQMGTLNKIVSGRTKSEYRSDNIDHIITRDKEYREINKDKISTLN